MPAKYRVKESSHREEGVTYMKGETVETEKDLVLLFGVDKFEYISGTPTLTGKHKPFNPKDILRANAKAQAAPGGQVHGGKQQTSTGKNGEPVSTILQPEDDDDETDFNAMTLHELQKYAKDNKIDLKGAKTKADVIEAIEDAEA